MKYSLGMVLRDLRSARQVAGMRIGPWPGSGSLAAGRGSAAASGVLGPSGSSVHARAVWNEVREAVCRRAGTLARVAGDAGFSQVRGLEGLVDLEFVGRLAGHVAGCSRCASRGKGRDTPEDWLLWAVGRRRGLREVLVPVLMAEGADGGERGGGIAWNPPGLDLWRKEAARRQIRGEKADV